MHRWLCGLLLIAALAGAAVADEGDPLHVACASNFRVSLEALRADLLREKGIELRISSGSTGKLYAQIRHGAPYDVFLAADAERPRRLVQEGLAYPETRFTYAGGRLILWSTRRNADVGEALLRRGEFARLAIANPKTAPFGAGAYETLEALGLWESLSARAVRAETVAQAFQYVAGGHAELGFIALAQLQQLPPGERGSHWVVPEHLYTPIDQQAVMLARSSRPEAARAFLAFLRSDAVRERIRVLGHIVRARD